jgi:hypothetical protein
VNWWAASALVLLLPLGCGTSVGRSPFWPERKPVPEYMECATSTDAPIRRRLKAFATVDHDGIARNVVAGDVTTGRGKSENEPGFRALASCYDEALGRDPRARGEVVLRYPVASGQDGGVCVSATTVPDGQFVACLMQALRPLATEWFVDEKAPVAAVIQLAQGEEEGTRWWYGPGHRWDGDQAPRMRDVPSDPAVGPPH